MLPLLELIPRPDGTEAALRIKSRFKSLVSSLSVGWTVCPALLWMARGLTFILHQTFISNNTSLRMA